MQERSVEQGLRSLAGRSVVYALGGLAYKGLALVTVPLLARLLEPAQLGLLDATAILASVVGLAAGLGTEQAVAWLGPRLNDDPRLWGSTLALVFAAGVIFSLGLFAVREPVAAVLTGSPENAGIVLAAGPYGIVIAMSAAALNAVRLRSTPARYAISSFVLVAAEVGTGLIIASLVTSPVQAMVLGWAGASAVVTAVIFFRTLPPLTTPNLGVVRRLLRFGLPLVPAAIAWLAGDAAIRSTIARETDLSTLGAYGIAYRVATGLGIFVTGFAVAWQPYLYRSGVTRARHRAREAGPPLLVVLAWAAIVTTLLAHEIVAVVSGTRYAAAVGGIPSLTGGMVALGMFMLLGALAGTTGATLRVGLAALAGMVIQVLAAAALVSDFGLSGAALASLLGYGVAATLLAIWTRFVSFDSLGLTFIATVIGAVIGLAGAASMMSAPLGIRLAASAVASVLAVVVLIAIRRPAEPLPA